MAAATKSLQCLEIKTAQKVFHRVLYTDETPNQEDLEFYYRTLLGFTDATITITCEEVPFDFNSSLLGIQDLAPSGWPACELETAPEDAEKRVKYLDYIQRLCEMERSRAALRLFMRNNASNTASASTRSPTDLYATNAVTQDEIYTTRRHRMKRSWVHEVLKKINEEIYGDDAYAIVACEMNEDPFGWILTPTMKGGRSSIGSRIVLNKEVGRKWLELLGTTFYPDLVVSGRISTASWAFQHALSNELIETTTRWYLASQDATLTDDISPFLPNADKDLATLFLAFRRVKISDRLLSEGAGTDRVSQVYKILSAIENTLLAPGGGEDGIQIIEYDTFLKYVQYTLRGFNIPREIYGSMEGVSQTVARWVRGRLGFVACVPPLLQAWGEIWTLLMGENPPTAIRVNLFLATLDSYDMVQVALMTQMDKLAISQEWIRVYIETQLVPDPDSKIRSTVLYEQVQLWCLKYLSGEVFGNQFSATYIGPILTRRGMIVKKEKTGRFMGGYRFKNFIGEEVPFAVQKKGWGGMGADFNGEKKARRRATTAATGATEAEADSDDSEMEEMDEPTTTASAAERTVLINETITTPVGVEKSQVMYSKVKTVKKTRTTVAASKKKTNATPATVEQFFVASSITKTHEAEESDEEEDVPDTMQGVINLGRV